MYLWVAVKAGSVNNYEKGPTYNLLLGFTVISDVHKPLFEIKHLLRTVLLTGFQKSPGPRLNIKTVLSRYGYSYVEDKTAVRTSYL